MVTVFLRGGVGNQMFQYAAGLALAEKNGTELVLDTVFLNDRWPRRNFSYRTFDLDIFMLEPKLTTLSKVSKKNSIPGMWLGLDVFLTKVRSVFGAQKLLKESAEFVFDPKVLESKGNITLWGRWQSEKYFADVAEKVRTAFAFRHDMTGEAAKIKEMIGSSNSVAVHVRRGDYAAFKSVAGMMGDTDLDYYDRAIKYIADKVSHPTFFIFSDDIEWCKKNIPISFPATYVSLASAGPKAAFHLELMSLCEHVITANSTFSWWGAWLNPNPNKIVITPKHWRAGRKEESPDLIPASWIKL